MRRNVRLFGVGVLLVLVGLAVLRSHVGTRLDGFTVDEAWHIVAGTAYVRHDDFRLNPEHPPLTKLWVGMFMPDDFVVPPPMQLSEKSQERELVEATMFLENDSNRAQQRARIAMWTLHALLLLALGLLVWRAFGLPWAAATLAVPAIEPTVAAHLPVVMTDLTLALGLAIAVVASGLLAAHWQWRWVAAAALGMGVALGAKHSALAGLAGVALVLLLAAGLGWRRGGRREVLRRGAMAVAAGLLAVLLLWAQYGLRFHAGADGTDAFNRSMEAKVADLNIPRWRAAVQFADDTRLLPRAYLWGLADTVRAGVEGRGQAAHFVWGEIHFGSAPWFTWPAVLASKIPLAVLLLAAAGAVALARLRLPAAARWPLWTLLAASVAHLLALGTAQGTYGGVRHALPLVLAVALLCGALAALAWQRRSRPLAAALAACLLAATAMTLPEPRAWEYHNELVGGSANAHHWFSNEGLDLGQRFAELRNFHDRVIAPTGLPMYSSYWFGEEQAQAAGLNYRRRVERLDDTNVDGLYEGFFVYPMPMTLPWPIYDWDPAEAFAELTLVERLGHVCVWRGRQRLPKTRAHNLYEAVTEHIYVKGGTDWARIAARLEEVVPVMPHHVGAAIELGNAYLRLGDRAAAMRAYQRVLHQDRVPVEALVRGQIEAQLAQLDSGGSAAALAPLRNPWME